MTNNEIFQLTPKRIFCPLCGDWHDWTGKALQSYDEDNPYVYECSDNDVEFTLWVKDDWIYIKSSEICTKLDDCIDDEISLEDIEFDMEESVIKFSTFVYTDKLVCSDECRKDCHYCNVCKLPSIGDKRGNGDDEFEFELEFKIEFTKRYYFDKYTQTDGEARIKQSQDLEREQEDKKSQGESNMRKKTTSRTSLRQQIYEHSPKENVELIKQFANKFKPVLKWAVPVASIYAAYRILNSDNYNLSINNISSICKEKLGFKLDSLEDKNGLKELLVIGGVCAGAYGVAKAASTIFSLKDNSDEDVSIEDIEDDMSQLEGISKKFSWLTPKTERMLPIALSVITVFVMTKEPWKMENKFTNKLHKLTEDWTIKAQVYSEMVQLFIQDKFNVNLSDENEQQKIKTFVFLAAIVGISVFLYGRKVLGNNAVSDGESDDQNQKESFLSDFISQILPIMKKLAPSVFSVIVTAMVSKKLLSADAIEETMVLDKSLVKDTISGYSPSEDFVDGIDDCGNEEN